MAVIFTGLLLPSAPAAAEESEVYKIPDLEALQNTFASLAERVSPSVVAIRTYKNMRVGSEDGVGIWGKAPNSDGTGMVLRSDGLILTNHHVLEGADDIRVTLFNGTEYEGEVVQSDVRSDLAVLEIEAERLRPITFGNVESIQTGYWCFAVGNPFGITSSTRGDPVVTFGNISALGANLTNQLDDTDTRYYGDLIQVSCPINPGNSGGPLFDLKGRVIGVVTAIVSRSGITEGAGFAIPICDRTRQIIDTLSEGRPVRYGYLGVAVVTNPEVLNKSSGQRARRGALVSDVIERNGPAAKANLRPNDLIVEFDGVMIKDADHLIRVVGATPVGSKAPVKYERNGRRHETVVTMAERPVPGNLHVLASGKAVKTLDWRGALLAEMDDATLQDFELPRSQAGVVVVSVEEGSVADRAGLKPHDIIVKYNRYRVRTVEEFHQADTQDSRLIKLGLRTGKAITMERYPGSR